MRITSPRSKHLECWCFYWPLSCIMLAYHDWLLPSLRCFFHFRWFLFIRFSHLQVRQRTAKHVTSKSFSPSFLAIFEIIIFIYMRCRYLPLLIIDMILIIASPSPASSLADDAPLREPTFSMPHYHAPQGTKSTTFARIACVLISHYRYYAFA